MACLPGIQRASLAMADVHPGYGFPIGGVGAFDLKDGVVSVAGVGYDINCGVRTLRTTLNRDEVEPKKERLADALSDRAAGLGSRGNIHLTVKEMDKVLVEGAGWVVRRGYGLAEDLEYVEERGCIAGADPATVGQKAKERELDQVGSLGSGNHYLEVQWVDEIYDAHVADAYHLFPGQILVSIHSGSRALGHQIGTDYIKVLEAASRKYGIPIRERGLVCAPYDSPEGRRYMAAVCCGINVAFANRQALAHLTRQAFQDALGIRADEMATLYEVTHNTAKVRGALGRWCEQAGRRPPQGCHSGIWPWPYRGAQGVSCGWAAGVGRWDDGDLLFHTSRDREGHGGDLWQCASRCGARAITQPGHQAVLGRHADQGVGSARSCVARSLQEGPG